MRAWLLALTCAPCLAAQTTVSILTTQAYDLKHGNLVYTEERRQADFPARPGQWSFTYRDAKGDVIVRRQVDFRKNPVTPDYRLEDLRDGYVEGVEATSGALRVFARRKSSEPMKETVLKVPSVAVVDAGFNFFIEQEWDRLVSGEVLKFNFVAPIEYDYFGFRVYKADNVVHNGRPAYRIHLDIDNWLFRIFVAPIRLTYDAASRRLMIYEGISNINNDEGKSHRVRMVFNYENL